MSPVESHEKLMSESLDLARFTFQNALDADMHVVLVPVPHLSPTRMSQLTNAITALVELAERP